MLSFTTTMAFHLEELAAPDPGRWPWPTFVVNIVGAFLLGYFGTRLLERLPTSSYRRPLLGTGFCGGLSRQTVVHNVTINAVLPGSVLTDRVRGTIEAEVKKTGKSYADVEKARVAGIPAGRLGTPEEFGDACAYLCSAQAGYITGQNLLLDGGSYSGTL